MLILTILLTLLIAVFFAWLPGRLEHRKSTAPISGRGRGWYWPFGFGRGASIPNPG